MFTLRESIQKSLGFSPFELVFGHSVHGPLKLLKENWLSEDTESLILLDYVSKFGSRLKKTCDLAQQNMKYSQSKKKCFIIGSHKTSFQFRRQDFSVITCQKEHTAGQRSWIIPSEKRVKPSV